MTVANRSPAPTVQNLPDNRSSMSLISRSSTPPHPVRWIRAYTQALTGDVTGLRLGIVREGFNLEESEADVDEAVEKAARSFESMGALVETVSIPWHLDGIHLWRAIAVEGATMLMIAGNSMGTNWKGHYTTGLQDIFAHGWQSRADDLSETTKLVVLMGQYMQDRYHGHYYSKAQNLARMLTAAYDQALSEYDLLVMPTLPMKATVIPRADCSRQEYTDRALEMIPNTCPFDVSGHPAISVPCGVSDGLPIGMMLVGRMGDDATVLRAADAYGRNS